MNTIAWLVLTLVVAPAAFVVLLFLLKASRRAVDPRQLALEDGEQMRALGMHSGPHGRMERRVFLTTH